MAQFYSKNHQSSANAFDGHKMFIGSIEVARDKEITYFDILDVFRKIFKNIKTEDFLM